MDIYNFVCIMENPAEQDINPEKQPNMREDSIRLYFSIGMFGGIISQTALQSYEYPPELKGAVCSVLSTILIYEFLKRFNKNTQEDEKGLDIRIRAFLTGFASTFLVLDTVYSFRENFGIIEPNVPLEREIFQV